MLLGTVLLLASCHEGESSFDKEETEDATLNSDITDAPGESKAPDTEAPDTTEVEETTAAPVVVGPFKLTDAVKIVYPSTADKTLKDAANKLAEEIKKAYGVTVKVGSDFAYSEGPEIMLGNCTNRESSVAFQDEFYSNGLGYAVLSDTEIAISALNPANVVAAVNLFVYGVVRKVAEPVFEVGTVGMKNNDVPEVNYTLNGVKLEDYTIVAEKADDPAALYLAKTIKQNLYTRLKVVAEASFGGGNAIKVGNYGSECYDGTRFSITAENVGGVSTVCVNGDTEALLSSAAEYFYTGFLSTKALEANFEVPETTYSYSFGNIQSTGLRFTEIVEQETLCEGVDYYQMKYTNKDGKNVDAFITVVSGSSPAKFRTWAGDMTHVDAGKAKFDVKTVAQQAKEYESVMGGEVVAASNASYFMKTAGTNHPWTMRVICGEELCPPRDTGKPLRPANWMGITYDGQLVTGNAETYYSTWKGKLEYALACGIYMMKDGKVEFQNGQNVEVNPLTAVATTADGGFVLLCVDGRPNNGKGTSEGGTSADMLGIILDLDMLYPDIEFVDVYTMDGGGSTEMILENGNGFETVNSPCDVKNGKRGNSRGIGDCILVVIPD